MKATGRFLAGALSALLLAGAGLFWWQSWAQSEAAAIPAPPPPQAAEPVLPSAEPGQRGAPLPMPPAATARTREEKRFARYDRNHDGIITRTEMMASRTNAFKKLDTDGNNLLSFEEWAVKTSDRFADADADHDGKLTPAEFATTAPKRSAKAKCGC